MSAPTPSLDKPELQRIHDEVRARLFRAPRVESSAHPDLGERYRVLRPIGRGGASVVWEIEHTGTGRRLAAKVLTLDQSFGGTANERLMQEARAVASIAHPNVVDVIDVGKSADGKPYLVMERLAGRTLEQVLLEDGPMAWERAFHRLRQVAAGLAAAHGIGLVHRDLKPANVMLIDEGTEHERCKVLDFGLARWRRLDEAASRLTRSGAIFGTPSYMSPEQIQRLDVDGRADVYALGCLAWELLAGRPPFAGESVAEILYQQLFEHPESPFGQGDSSREQRRVDAWIRRCMRKRPDLRFADMPAAIDGLDGIARGAAPVSVPDEAPLVATSSGTHSPMRAYATTIAALALVLATALVVLGRSNPSAAVDRSLHGIADAAVVIERSPPVPARPPVVVTSSASPVLPRTIAPPPTTEPRVRPARRRSAERTERASEATVASTPGEAVVHPVAEAQPIAPAPPPASSEVSTSLDRAFRRPLQKRRPRPRGP